MINKNKEINKLTQELEAARLQINQQITTI